MFLDYNFYMDIYDKKLVYYYNTKTLVSFLVSPLPFVYSATYSIIKLIQFIPTVAPNVSVLPFALGILNLWIGTVIAYQIYNDAQKQYDMVHLSSHPSYIKPIVIPILWLLGCMIAWFLTLPLYVMYTRRY